MAELKVDITYGTALLEAARDTGKEEQILLLEISENGTLTV